MLYRVFGCVVLVFSIIGMMTILDIWKTRDRSAKSWDLFFKFLYCVSWFILSGLILYYS